MSGTELLKLKLPSGFFFLSLLVALSPPALQAYGSGVDGTWCPMLSGHLYRGSSALILFRVMCSWHQENDPFCFCKSHIFGHAAVGGQSYLAGLVCPVACLQLLSTLRFPNKALTKLEVFPFVLNLTVWGQGLATLFDLGFTLLLPSQSWFPWWAHWAVN